MREITYAEIKNLHPNLCSKQKRIVERIQEKGKPSDNKKIATFPLMVSFFVFEICFLLITHGHYRIAQVLQKLGFKGKNRDVAETLETDIEIKSEGGLKESNMDEQVRDTNNTYRPSLDELKAELRREKRKKNYTKTLRNTIVVLVVVAAFSVLVSSFFITVLKVTGDSMTPTLETGQIVIANNYSTFEPGELIAFYYNNRVLVKRVIGSPGDWVNIDDNGVVYVNGESLDEPYVSDASQYPNTGSESDRIEFPFQVPENRYFVLGDHRTESIDSRTNTVGCVTQEQLIGEVVFRVFPFNVIGTF